MPDGPFVNGSSTAVTFGSASEWSPGLVVSPLRSRLRAPTRARRAAAGRNGSLRGTPPSPACGRGGRHGDEGGPPLVTRLHRARAQPHLRRRHHLPAPGEWQEPVPRDSRCYSRRLAGWALADHMCTDLLETALRDARGTLTGAVFHSDHAQPSSSERRPEGETRGHVAPERSSAVTPDEPCVLGPP